MSNTFTPLDDALTTEGNLVSVETFTAIANGLAYLQDSMPVGTEVVVLTGFPGVPTPNPQIWQLCDGSLVTNQNSPLRNQNTPNRASTGFLHRGAAAGQVGLTGGTNTKDFTHAHGGLTGVFTPRPNNLDEEDVFNEGIAHAHGIFQDLSVRNVEPPNIRLNHYIKIL
jgi:hypothetical protein